MLEHEHSTVYVTSRALVCLTLLGMLLSALTSPRRPTASLNDALSAEAGVTVVPGSVHSERPTELGITDALVGRRVVFLGRSERGVGDVYRARVRITPGGRLLGISSLVNLTRSPLGDDGDLVATDGRVAFTTRAYGQVQNVTMLVWHEARAERVGLRRAITSLLETGALAPLVRWDLRLDRPIDTVSLEFQGDSLLVRAPSRRWSIAPDGSLTVGDGATMARTRELDKPVVIWAVDTVRGLSFVGPAPITWLEETVFDARDRWRRMAFRWFGVRPRNRPATVDPMELPVDSHGRVIENAAARSDDPFWPPPRVEPPLPDPDRGEGQWVPAAPRWVRTLDPVAPPAFYKTFLRMDRERPYSRVVVVAMDMRQLDLAMQPGVEDPVPLVGPRGDGRIPRRQLPRVVAAFNGAFKTEHGEYGMVVNRRVLLPPRSRAATVAVMDDGRVALGTWGESSTLPDAMVSLRQNLDPLVADGQENPTRRSLWGFVLGGIETMPTVRSGLCEDAHGHVMYFWGEETTARFLARAMNRVGCVYGMHLDMNPSHALFNFVRVDDPGGRNPQARGLAEGMSSSDERFVNYSLKDFFYVMLRDPSPPALSGALAGTAWSSAMTQPAPAWSPRFFRAETSAVRLTSLPIARVDLALRAGRIEHGAAPAALTTLSAPSGEVLGVLELGAPAAGTPRGVQVEGARASMFTPGRAWFGVVRGSPEIHTDGAAIPAECDAIEGVTLLRAGTYVDAQTSGGAEAIAVGLTADRRLLVAEGSAGWAPLAGALRDAGARDAIGLSGPSGEVGVHWRSAETPLHEGYPGAVLFVMDRPEPARVVRLEPLLAPR